MPNPTTLRERRLRMTKAQLIDEIDTARHPNASGGGVARFTVIDTDTDVSAEGLGGRLRDALHHQGPRPQYLVALRVAGSGRPENLGCGLERGLAER